MRSEFLTKVATDWSDSNLSELQIALREAETATFARTDPIADPMLQSPNLPNLRGQMRWILAPQFLEQAVNAGRFPGITANWVNLGGVSQFELCGQHTTVSLVHLHYPDDTPRDSTLRKHQRRANQAAQLVMDFEQEPRGGDSEIAHLLLVHGGKDGEFAFLRIYYDQELRSAYRQLSSNIMLIPRLVEPFEQEEISEPSIVLKQTNIKRAGLSQ